MAQGKRALTREPATGRWMVKAPDREGAVFVPPGRASTPAPVFETRSRPMDELREEIRTLSSLPGPAPTQSPLKGQ